MASDFWNIFLNVVAAFIYAAIVWLWQNRGKKGQPPLQKPSPPAPTLSNKPIDYRARNRHVLEAGTQAFLFYFITFATLYLSITMPALFKALFAKEPVLLSQARHIGEFLPPISVGKDYLQITFFIVSATIYWPLLVLSEVMMSLLYPLVDAFLPMTKRIRNAITMLMFLVFCIPVAATSIWLFYEKSYTDSLLTVLFFLFLAFALGQSQGGRR